MGVFLRESCRWREVGARRCYLLGTLRHGIGRDGDALGWHSEAKEPQLETMKGETDRQAPILQDDRSRKAHKLTCGQCV